jgi:MerR family mercuric resistance operon transcriptional regulator
MKNNLDLVTISVLADTAGVNVETIRFYQRKDLISKPRKQYGGIRRYSENDLARVRFIKAAQRLGFSLNEVGELLKLEDGAHCDEARILAEYKLKDVRDKLANLHHIESVLAQLVDDCCAAKGTITCPIIAALQVR